MLVRQQRLDLGMVQQPGHEFLKDVASLQPFAVLGERRGIPHRVVWREPDEPAIQQIIVELFDQLAFRADAVKGLQQQRAQQLLRGNRGAAFARIKPPETRTQLLENGTHQVPHSPKRMRRRNPLLWRYVREQPTLIPKPAAHLAPKP